MLEIAFHQIVLSEDATLDVGKLSENSAKKLKKRFRANESKCEKNGANRSLCGCIYFSNKLGVDTPLALWYKNKAPFEKSCVSKLF